MATIIKKTVAPSGGDFTSLQSALTWFRNNYPNFVSSDIIGEIEISGTWSSADTTPAEIYSTITTDSTHYVYIHTVGDARHPGYWSDSAYRLIVTSGRCIRFETLDAVIDGLQLKLNHTNSASCCYFTSSASGKSILLSNCLLRGGNSTSAAQKGIENVNANVTVYVWNTCIYDISNYTDSYLVGTYNIYMYNCVGIGGYRGTLCYSSGDIVAKNCYIASGSGGCYHTLVSKTTCASSDSTGSSGLTNIAVADAGFVNVSSGSEDFHLASTSSPLYHTGTDTSGDTAPMNFTTDIDGDNYYDTDGVRSIGVDEISAGNDYVLIVNE